MGNKLCALWGRRKSHKRRRRKPNCDGLLLRMWGEIFQVRPTGDDGKLAWIRLSDDVAPINVTCCGCHGDRTPETVYVYQVAAYNRFVEKILDVSIPQPGTAVKQGAECFVYWKDVTTNDYWGLNFVDPNDAFRFKECCAGTSASVLSRRASSMASVKIPPPKRVRAGLVQSEPSTPAADFDPLPRPAADHSSSPADVTPRSASDVETGGIDGEGVAHILRLPKSLPTTESVAAHGRVGSSESLRDRCVRLGGAEFEQTMENDEEVDPEESSAPRQQLQQQRAQSLSASSIYDNVALADATTDQEDERHVLGEISYCAAVHSRDYSNTTTTTTTTATGSTSSLDTVVQQPTRYNVEERDADTSQHHVTVTSDSKPLRRSSTWNSLERAAAAVRPRRWIDADELLVMRLSRSTGDAVTLSLDRGQPASVPAAFTRSHESVVFSPTSASQNVVSGLSRRRPEVHGFPVTPRHASRSTAKSSDEEESTGLELTEMTGKGRSSPTGSAGNTPSPTVSSKPPTGPSPSKLHSRRSSNVSLECRLGNAVEINASNGTEAESDSSCQLQRTIGNRRTTKFPTNTSKKSSRSFSDCDGCDVARATSTDEGSSSSSGSGIDDANALSGGPTGAEPLLSASVGAEPGPRAPADGSDDCTATVTSARHLRSAESVDTGSDSDFCHREGGVLESGDDDIIDYNNNDDDDADADDNDASSVTSDASTGSRCGSRSRSQSTSELLQLTLPTKIAGWLLTKNWLCRKKQKIVLARRRQWVRYWVELRGTRMFFHAAPTSTSLTTVNTRTSNVELESSCQHVFAVHCALAQKFPEHPKKENVFVVSSATGDAFQFQARSSCEVDRWVTALHTVCAVTMCRQRRCNDAERMLTADINKLDSSLQQDRQMKMIAELQLNVVTDARSRQAIHRQMAQWEAKLERHLLEQYRLRCYLAALTSSQHPSPKSVLLHASRDIKNALTRIDVSLCVSAFHALVAARTTSASNGNTGNRCSALSKTAATSLQNIGGGELKSKRPLAVTSSNTTVIGGSIPADCDVSGIYLADTTADSSGNRLAEKLLKVYLPQEQTAVLVEVTTCSTVRDVLVAACNRRQLNVDDHFVRIVRRINECLPVQDNSSVPDSAALLFERDFQSVELCQKALRQVTLVRHRKPAVPDAVTDVADSGSTINDAFGLTVEAELAEEREDELRVFISDVTDNSVAQKAGLVIGDEILVVDGCVVSSLDFTSVQSTLRSLDSVCLTIRTTSNDCNVAADGGHSCCVEQRSAASPIHSHSPGGSTVETLVCPPPPPQQWIDDRTLGQMTIPAPQQLFAERNGCGVNCRVVISSEDAANKHDTSATPSRPPVPASPQIDRLLLGADRLTQFCHLLQTSRQEEESQTHLHIISAAATTASAVGDDGSSGEVGASQRSSLSKCDVVERPTLSQTERIHKVVVELVTTEQQYVKDLNCLVKRYLEPLKDETFVSADDVVKLFGNIRDIIRFQQQLLDSLELAMGSVRDGREQSDSNGSSTHPADIHNILLQLARSFQSHAAHFRRYCSFCASHSRAQKLLASDNRQLREFLRARNPKCQHSASLESFLIKPIQRVLKYPLLLRQLVDLTADNIFHVEHEQLNVALQCMESVAEYINETQKVHEDYGQIFDELIRQHSVSCPNMDLDLSVGELQLYGTVNWLNAPDHVTRPTRRTSGSGCSDLQTLIFVFNTWLVLLVREQQFTRDKKKFRNRLSTGYLAPGGNLQPTDSTQDTVRWKTVIPLVELEVRVSAAEDGADWEAEEEEEVWKKRDDDVVDGGGRAVGGVWELAHRKSEKEGRPGMVYQFAGTDDVRRECARLIHQSVGCGHQQTDNRFCKQPLQLLKFCRHDNQRSPHHLHTSSSLSPARSQPNISEARNFDRTPTVARNNSSSRRHRSCSAGRRLPSNSGRQSPMTAGCRRSCGPEPVGLPVAGIDGRGRQHHHGGSAVDEVAVGVIGAKDGTFLARHRRSRSATSRSTKQQQQQQPAPSRQPAVGRDRQWNENDEDGSVKLRRQSLNLTDANRTEAIELRTSSNINWLKSPNGAR